MNKATTTPSNSQARQVADGKQDSRILYLDRQALRSYVASLGITRIDKLKNAVSIVGGLSAMALIVILGAGAVTGLMLDLSEQQQKLVTGRLILAGGISFVLMLAFFMLDAVLGKLSPNHRHSHLDDEYLPLADRLKSLSNEIVRNEVELGDATGTDAENITRHLGELKAERSSLRIRLNLEERLDRVSEVLRNCLENTSAQRQTYSLAAKNFRQGAGLVLFLALTWLFAGILLTILPSDLTFGVTLPSNIRTDFALTAAAIAFPLTILFVISTMLLKHEAKLTREVRHYTSQQYYVELLSGIISAAQYVDSDENSSAIVKQTFEMVRERVLASNSQVTQDSSQALEAPSDPVPDVPLVAMLKELNALRKG